MLTYIPMLSQHHIHLLQWTIITVILLGTVDSLVLRKIKVPSPALAGDDVQLICEYDLLDDQKLYSLTWYKDDVPIFIYKPENRNSQTFNEVPGVHVDIEKSREGVVFINNVSLQTEGHYKCEIVIEDTYERDHKGHNMTVIDFPDSRPIITVERRMYRPGDFLFANCTSPNSNPASNITWTINDFPVDGRFYRVLPNSEVPRMGLYSTVSQLKIRLRKSSFVNGNISLICSAHIGHIYYEIKQVDLRLKGSKNVATILKLFGSGCKIPISFYLMKFTLCLVLAVNLMFAN